MNIDRQNRIEAEQRRRNRRSEDVRRGVTLSSAPHRGDYPLCRDLDKTIRDYHRFKDPKDRVKINAEYYGKQKEYQRNNVLGK